MRKAASRAEWRQRVEDFARSGRKARDYAEAKGLSYKMLLWWRSRLRLDAEKGRRGGRTATRAPTKFIEVTPEAAPAATTMFEVELGSGRRIRLSAQFDADALQRLISVLEGAS
jgi:hypothetical protein